MPKTSRILQIISLYSDSTRARRLWFSAKSSFWDLVGHGFVLTIVLLIIGFFITWIPSQMFPGLAIQVYSFIVGSFVNGFFGKTVAGWFRSDWPEEVPASIEREWEGKRLQIEVRIYLVDQLTKPDFET